MPNRGRLKWIGPFALLCVSTHCGSPPCVEGEPCSGTPPAPDGSAPEGSTPGSSEAGSETGTPQDAAPGDGAIGPRDSGPPLADGSSLDASMDGAPSDSGLDASPGDSGADAADGSPGTGGCVSGAIGSHVARFRWSGTGPSSRAYVTYEANNLPDRARWRAGAYSRSGVGYIPNFTDTFLGVGGLEMGSTVFIDVELSTSMLASIRHVTLAIFGRSFNTTASGSFSWLTFDGAGATPSGAVSNVAPYRWYSADATSAFRAGNPGVLLRISPGPPSSTLIVSRVELCFDAR